MLPSAEKPLTARTARSVLRPRFSAQIAISDAKHVQSKNLWRVACLDAIALALPRVTGDDREVRTSDGQDGTAIFSVGVELPFLGVRK